MNNNFLKELKILIVLAVVVFTIKASLAEVYVVPTGSMEDNIYPGDMIIGNKFIYGMRTPTWLGIPFTRFGFDIPWYRLSEFKKIQRESRLDIIGVIIQKIGFCGAIAVLCCKSIQ